VSKARIAIAIVTAAAIVRLGFAALLPPFPDETYYWAWSRRLAAGYFDHPPVVAWLIRSGDALLAPLRASPSAFSIRLGPVLASWVAAVATVATSRRLAGDGAALRAAVIITVMPLAAAGLILATPDSAVLAGVALTLYCLVRALEHAPRSRDSLVWWIAAGVALGLAFSSKYTSIFLPVGVLIAAALHPKLRPRLGEPGPYVACAIATLIFAPVLVWNASHGWISFAYQVRHGLASPQGSALVAAWKHEGDLFGGQAALASPILFVMLAITVARALKRSAPAERFMLAIVTLISFGFFVYSGLRQRVEPNWPSPAYIPAIALLAATEWGVLGTKWLRAGVVLAAVMSVVIYVQALAPVLPLAPSRDPVARAFGWGELAQRTAARATSTAIITGHTTWIAGDRYQEASELAFHIRAHPETFAMNVAGRPNQYDLWPRFSDVAKPGDNLLLVVDEGAEPHAAVTTLAPYFAEVRKSDLMVLRRNGRHVGTRRAWLMLSWNGKPLPGGSTGAP
jgi:4-amino-4-deoxy-L-arabinose transferase-like glycosyltransferase